MLEDSGGILLLFFGKIPDLFDSRFKRINHASTIAQLVCAGALRERMERPIC